MSKKESQRAAVGKIPRKRLITLVRAFPGLFPRQVTGDLRTAPGPEEIQRAGLGPEHASSEQRARRRARYDALRTHDPCKIVRLIGLYEQVLGALLPALKAVTLLLALLTGRA